MNQIILGEDREVLNTSQGWSRSHMLIAMVSTSLGLVLGGTGSAIWYSPGSVKNEPKSMPQSLEKTFGGNDDLITFVGRSKKLKISGKEPHILEINIPSVLSRPIQKSQYPNELYSTIFEILPIEESIESDKSTAVNPEIPLSIKPLSPTGDKNQEGKEIKDVDRSESPLPHKNIIQDDGSVVYDGSPESTKQLSRLLKELFPPSVKKKK